MSVAEASPADLVFNAMVKAFAATLVVIVKFEISYAESVEADEAGLYNGISLTPLLVQSHWPLPRFHL